MPGLPLSDTQNRYLALAWLCVDAEPKVSTLTSITQGCLGKLQSTCSVQQYKLLKDTINPHSSWAWN